VSGPTSRGPLPLPSINARCLRSAFESMTEDWSGHLPSFLKNFRDDFQTPPKDFHLLRGFSSQRFVIPKHSLKTWSVNRTPFNALPTLKEH